MAAPDIPALFDQMARGWRGYALIAFIALMSAMPGQTKMPVLDRDEARFAQATRQMVETGDYVRIRIQDDDRNKKPIGIHWLQAAAVQATAPLNDGRINEIWSYRLPSVLGALIAALACFWGGTAVMDRRSAFLGAALFASCYLLGIEAMIAKTDAMLAGCTTLAMAALAHLWRIERGGEGGPKRLALLFWIACGAGVLIKGPVAPMVATLTVLALCVWERRWLWVKPLLFWPGPLAAALMVAPWMIAIGLATKGQFFLEAITEDLAPKVAGGQEGHFAWPGSHLLALPMLIFPAALALPAAARLAWRSMKAPRSEDQPLRFLICWAVPSFLVFEIMPTKLLHYTLPVFPALALLCGAAMFTSARERWRLPNVLGLVLFLLAGASIIALTAYLATFMPGDEAADMRRAVQAALIGSGILIAASVAIVFAREPFGKAASGIVAILALAFVLRHHVLPEARSLHVSAEAAAALTRARLLPTDTRPLWVVGYGETSLVFLTRSDIRIELPEDAGARAQVGDAMLIESRDLAATEAELAARGLVFAREGAPVSGLNYGNGDRVDLYPGEVEPAP